MVGEDNITLFKGEPEVEKINNLVIIFDDLMGQVVDDKNFFTVFFFSLQIHVLFIREPFFIQNS